MQLIVKNIIGGVVTIGGLVKRIYPTLYLGETLLELLGHGLSHYHLREEHELSTLLDVGQLETIEEAIGVGDELVLNSGSGLFKLLVCSFLKRK